ncbi:MAG: hypothetical protein GYA34_13760 [Chloroflexi bacterium]|nr:hypothetical protein [Chloroflexota bacterium]
MTSGLFSKQIVLERLDWVERMVEEIRCLPLSDPIKLFMENRNRYPAELYLRHALEAILDLD